MKDRAHCTAFAGTRRVASGSLVEVALQTQAQGLDPGREPVLIFDDVTGEQVDVDWSGTADEVRTRLVPDQEPEPARGPGRPKLGVVAREVTLLPRHWAWLAEQPGGASVALRKLVENARQEGEGADRARKAREAAYRVLVALGGNLPGFEEASRALFAGDRNRFDAELKAWPPDVRNHVQSLASASFSGTDVS